MGDLMNKKELKNVPNERFVKELEDIANDILTTKQVILCGYIKIGELLTEAKSKCKHGEWLPFLKDSRIKFSESTARKYMKIYRVLSPYIQYSNLFNELNFSNLYNLCMLNEDQIEEALTTSNDVKELKEAINNYTKPKNVPDERFNEEINKKDEEIKKLKYELEKQRYFTWNDTELGKLYTPYLFTADSCLEYYSKFQNYLIETDKYKFSDEFNSKLTYFKTGFKLYSLSVYLETLKNSIKDYECYYLECEEIDDPKLAEYDMLHLNRLDEILEFLTPSTIANIPSNEELFNRYNDLLEPIEAGIDLITVITVISKLILEHHDTLNTGDLVQ